MPERDHFDAVGSLEMGEHVGERNYPTYVEVLRRAVRPGGRVLVQQMSRTGRHPGGGPFIEAFIAPDMHMRPVGETVGLPRGRRAWRSATCTRCASTTCGPWPEWLENFEAHVAELTALVGEEVGRVWRLYLVGGALAFREGRMGVDQILVRPPRGRARAAAGSGLVIAHLVGAGPPGRRRRRRGHGGHRPGRPPRRPRLGRRRDVGPGAGRDRAGAGRRRRPPRPGGAGSSSRWSRCGAAGWRGTSCSARAARARTRATRSCSTAGVSVASRCAGCSSPRESRSA